MLQRLFRFFSLRCVWAVNAQGIQILLVSRSTAMSCAFVHTDNGVCTGVMAEKDSDGVSNGCCSFAVTGPHAWWQAIYVCRDCEEEGALQCICEACAEKCHADHDVEYIGMGPSYCDCGTRCAIAQQSRDAAIELHVLGLNEPKKTEDVYEPQAYLIPELTDQGVCQRLIQQSIALAKFPRDTFWISANHDGKDLCELERLALAIFQNHASTSCAENLAGAEWWVQVKDLASENAAVDIHYDKDENLAEKFGLGSFPLLSTVTYLTENAYPTLVFPHCYDEAEDEPMDGVVVSHPRRGKHLVFDGRLLHGAPACEAMCRSESDAESIGTRVTFLVNLWQYAKPCGINSLDPTVQDTIKQSVEKLETKAVGDLDMELTKIERLELTDEEGLRPEHCDRIILPFVSKGATWVEDDEQGPNLVLVTFPPPRHESDIVCVKFGPGMQAYLEYHADDEEQDEEMSNSEHPLQDYV